MQALTPVTGRVTTSARNDDDDLGRCSTMVSIRNATLDDLLQMQHCNLSCLPNYQMKYTFIMRCPGRSSCVRLKKKMGYVLAKMEDSPEVHGHITSRHIAITP